MVVLYFLQYVGWSKLLVVVDENISSGYPLSVQLSPYSFSPTCIGDGEMKAVLFQIVPETTGDNMSQRIGEIMCNHFGLTGRSAGEVHQRDIIVGVWMFRFSERGCIFNALMKIFESFCYFRANTYQMFHCRRVRHGIYDMFSNNLFSGCYDHLYIGCIAAIYDVFLG